MNNTKTYIYGDLVGSWYLCFMVTKNRLIVATLI